MSAKTLGSLVLLLVTAGCQATSESTSAPTATASAHGLSRPALGLMTTLPIFWGEANDVGELLQRKTAAGWVREVLERDFSLEPLDTLDDAQLATLSGLVLAQPRPLAAGENVALDDWVRKGGQLLLFADPMLTAQSRYAIGDRRRPQDVVLLSPILSHWGLTLTFDESQRVGERRLNAGGVSLPVHLAGALRQGSGGPCAVRLSGIIADCRIGKGKVTIVADAAVLEDAESDAADARRAALADLLASAFTRP